MSKTFLEHPPRISLIAAGLGQWIALTLFGLFVLESEVLATAFGSQLLWSNLLFALGGSVQQTPDGPVAIASLGGLAFATFVVCALATLIAAAVTVRRRDVSFGAALAQKCLGNGLWTIPVLVWSIGWIISLLLSGSGLTLLLVQTVKMALAATLAGWLWEILREFAHSSKRIARQPASNDEISHRPRWKTVTLAMVAYVLVFTGMNWGLWFNLQLPHGDSSMYEEHLWNFLHGKGFRSYLDQGLFLGEHIQVIHLLLLPLYILWPSHLLLELCESTALALGAVPVYWIAQRHSGSHRAAMWAALAYLLYFPMQYLDIAIDLKTFRPGAFGIPILLFLIDAAERRKWGWMSLWVILALACQEDFGVALGPFGLWLLLDGWLRMKRQSGTSPASVKGQLVAGTILTVLIPLYVVLAVKVAIPWFHDGATVHYASYFQAFGKTPVEIVINIITNPPLLLKHLLTAGSVALLLDLLLPVGMPLRAWSRLLVGLPLFVLLCLNELTKDFPGPFHHFHAPLVPILIWAACANLSIRRGDENSHQSQEGESAEDRHCEQRFTQRAIWMFSCALATSLFFSLSPLGIAFWDAGGPFFWHRLYVPDQRAKEFAKIPPLIPQSARVASTDFVHPRFTHYERSYDYSHYPRRVADYEDKVPDDTEYIVIDTGHRYSEIKSFEQTREYQNQRDQWEVVPVDTNGYFIVLKRIKFPQDSDGNAVQP